MRQAEDETSDSDSANILCSPKVLDYLEVYIFPLALLWSGLLLGEVNEKFVCQECFNLIFNVLNLSPISIKKCNVTGGSFLGTISRAVEARTRALISTPMAFFFPVDVCKVIWPISFSCAYPLISYFVVVFKGDLGRFTLHTRKVKVSWFPNEICMHSTNVIESIFASNLGE